MGGGDPVLSKVEKPLKIFISGPYTAKTDEAVMVNVRKALYGGFQVSCLGHYPLVPHLNHYIDRDAQRAGYRPFSWEHWMRWCLSYLPMCDAVYSLKPSKGADIERKFALDNDIPVYDYIHNIPMLAGYNPLEKE